MGLGKKMGMLLVVVAALLALGLSAGTALACDSNIIGDFVWNDLNANGIQDAGEPGIALVTVELHKCCDDSLVGSTTTDANGKYLFTDVYHGSYYIKFTLLNGYTFSLQDQGTDNKFDSDANAAGVTACTYLYDSDDRTWDAGMYLQPASVGDFVWNDANKNGIQDDGESSGIYGVTVNLYKCGETTPVATAETDGSGYYNFTNLVPGSYYLEFTTGLNYVFSPKDIGGDAADSDADPSTGKTDCFTLNPGVNDLTLDVGLYVQEPHNPPVVPAISTWGIAGMAAAMAVVAGFMLRRRVTDSTR